MKKIPQDIVGNIAILKFKRGVPFIIKKIKAYLFLRKNKNIRTVVEKIEKFSGDLRIQKTRHLAGLRTKETIYHENDCVFKFNIDETYFSPRLSNERKLVTDEVIKIIKKKKNPKVLVMFSGVGPYPIVLAKKVKKLKIKSLIFSNELNKVANEYEKENILLNKVSDYVIQFPGDARTLPERLNHKFDVILMPRPNIQDTFLDVALKLSKRGTVIFYHGFGTKEKVLDEIKKDCGKRIGKIDIRKAGDIGPRVYRWQSTFKVKSVV